MNKEQILSEYMPVDAAPIIGKWIDYFQCEFKISRRRTTKLGDYRHPYNGNGHKISVNNSLNAYAFLVTTVHEFAHLLTWNDHKNKVKPHGEEWKRNFNRLMVPFLDKRIFPEDIREAIVCYLKNPSAASCTDLKLSRALKKYDHHQEDRLRVEEIPTDAVFKIEDGRSFRKGERLRKRYRCVCLDNGNVYLFNPLAEVCLLASGM